MADEAITGQEIHCKFDLWMNDRWIGMIYGADPEEARRLVTHYHPAINPECILIIPFYGLGTSQRTYQALTGRQPRMPDAEHQEYNVAAHIRDGKFTAVSL